MANAILFNCCTGYAAPDWSQFKSLEIGGCITETMPDGGTFTIGGKTDGEAEFWTVYARHHSGEAKAITDCQTRAAADATAATLAGMSALPLRSDIRSLDSMVAEYMAWNASQGVSLGSAADHVADATLTETQRAWLVDFSARWEAIESAECPLHLIP